MRPDPFVIAIDGPGAAGKSTVADQLARQLHAMLFDTGAIYRAVTLAAHRAGIATGDAARLAELARHLPIAMRPPSVEDGRQVDVLLDDEDVTWAIRTPEIDSTVSAVSAHPAVRQALLHTQREIADDAMVVMVRRAGSAAPVRQNERKLSMIKPFTSSLPPVVRR